MFRSVVLKRDDDKRELIHRLSDQRKELLVVGGDWDDPPVGVENVAKNVAKIRPPYDYDTLEEWWIHGN